MTTKMTTIRESGSFFAFEQRRVAQLGACGSLWRYVAPQAQAQQRSKPSTAPHSWRLNVLDSAAERISRSLDDRILDI